MTIREIAEYANVSPATVSKVINGKDHDISKATRDRVLQVVKAYQYVPYSNLREMMAKSISVVALLISYPLFENTAFFSAIERLAKNSGFNLIICQSIEDETDLQQQLKMLLAKFVDGVILCVDKLSYLDIAKRILGNTVPFCVLSPFDLPENNACRYLHQKSAYLAVDALLALGHQRIGVLLDDAASKFTTGEVVIGIQKCLSNYGLSWSEETFLHLDLSQNNTERIYQRFAQNITAFYCQTSLIADACTRMALEKGLRIPQDFSVVLDNGTPPIPTTKPVSASLVPYDEIGENMFSMLLAQIYHNKVGKKELTASAHFQSGQSSAPPPDSGPGVVVVGNCVTNVFIYTQKIPAANEQQISQFVNSIPGGKCVDQSIGVAKLGAEAYIVGRIGKDSEGQEIRNRLLANSVHLDGLVSDQTSASGKSFLTIPQGGGTATVSYPGANLNLDIRQIRESRNLFQKAGYCLITTEIPPNIIKYVLRLCEEFQVVSFLKPSNPRSFSLSLLSSVDYFIPNRSEAARLLKKDSGEVNMAETFFSAGCENVIITLGGDGCYLRNRQHKLHVPAAPFQSVDPTGAACCFIDALAVEIGAGNSLPYALCYATFAAGLSISQLGTHPSFPTKQQMSLYYDEINHLYNKICRQYALSL